jgi:hypothetical protein
MNMPLILGNAAYTVYVGEVKQECREPIRLDPYMPPLDGFVGNVLVTLLDSELSKY